MSLKRRTFIIVGAGAAVGAGTYAWMRKLGYDVSPSRDAGLGPTRDPTRDTNAPPFDPRALEVLAVLANDVLPGDAEGAPSAQDAGVVDYCVKAAALRGMAPIRKDLLKLCRAVDLAAEPQRYPELEPAERIAVLAQAESGAYDRGGFRSARALELLVRLSLEGYLGHPHHGGNRDNSVWDALAIDMPRMRNAGGHH